MNPDDTLTALGLLLLGATIGSTLTIIAGLCRLALGG